MKSIIPFKIYLRTVEAVLLDLDLYFEENSMKTDLKSEYKYLVELYESEPKANEVSGIELELELDYSIARLLEILNNASNKFNKTLRDNGVEEVVVLGIGESKEEILSDIKDIEDDIIKDLKEFLGSEEKTLGMLRDAFKGEFITMPNLQKINNKEFINKNIRDIKTVIGTYDKDFKKHLLENLIEIENLYNSDYDYFTDFEDGYDSYMDCNDNDFFEYTYDYFDADFDEDFFDDDYNDLFEYDYYYYENENKNREEYEYKGKRYDISYLFCLEDEGDTYKFSIKELEDNTKELLGDPRLIKEFNSAVWLLIDSEYLEDDSKLRSVILKELGK